MTKMKHVINLLVILCKVVYDYEKLIVYRKLAEDRETFDYILSLPNHKVKMYGARRWFTIHSGSFIHPVPLTYILYIYCGMVLSRTWSKMY